MTLEEKRTEVKQILELINKKKAGFFGIDANGAIVLNVKLDELKQIKKLLDKARLIGPEDAPTLRKLQEAEESYHTYLNKYMEQ